MLALLACYRLMVLLIQQYRSLNVRKVLTVDGSGDDRTFHRLAPSLGLTGYGH